MAKLYEETCKLPNPEGDLESLWNKYASLISALPQKYLRDIYLLMYHCSCLEGSSGKNSTPYKGKVFESGKGVLYTIENITIDTQMLLIKYLIHVHEDS